jgi:hypothetical protein
MSNTRKYLKRCASDLHDEDNTLIRNPEVIKMVCEDILTLYAIERGYEVIDQHRDIQDSFYEWTQGLPYNFFDYHDGDPTKVYNEIFYGDELSRPYAPNEVLRKQITYTIFSTLLLYSQLFETEEDEVQGRDRLTEFIREKYIH